MRCGWCCSSLHPPEPSAWAYKGSGYPGGGRSHQGLVTTCVAASSRRWIDLFFGRRGPGSSRGAFPLSSVENFLMGAIVVSSGARRKKQASEEEMGNVGSAPSPFISREGQPASPTIAGNGGFPYISQGLVKSCSCRGSMGKRRCRRPINRHTSTEAAGFWGPRCSELDPWLRREAKPERTLGPGATVGVLGAGVPRLACLRPTAWLSKQAVRPIFINKAPKTLARGQASRGAKPREADDTRPPLERPSQAGSRGAEIPRQSGPHEALVT